MYNLFNNYFVDEKVLCAKQFSFQKDLSTEDVIDQLVNHLKKRNLLLGTFVDSAKAIHTIFQK